MLITLILISFTSIFVTICLFTITYHYVLLCSTKVMFHSFHDILASTDGDSISVWSLANSSRILHIPNKTNLNRASGGRAVGTSSRPQSGSSAPINQSTTNLPGIHGVNNIAPGASTPTAGSASTSVVAGSFSQQNLSYPVAVTGGRGDRFSPEIVPVAPSTAPGAMITSMSWINESYDALLLVSTSIIFVIYY